MQPGVLSFYGSIGTAHMHAHAAIQHLHLAEGHVTLTDASGRQRQATHALIPTAVRHELTAAPGSHGTITYLDPASHPGSVAAEALHTTGNPISNVDIWIVAATELDAAPETAKGVLHPVVRHLTTIAGQLVNGPMTLTNVARQAGLSPSRLGHLFAEQLGLSFPAWRRWTRLQHAIQHLQTGATVTEAAHAAGFADSSHLTRTCRAMFGITPTQALHALAPASR